MGQLRNIMTGSLLRRRVRGPAAGQRIATVILIAYAIAWLAKLLVVYRDHTVDTPLDNYLLEAFAAAGSSSLILASLALVAALIARLPLFVRTVGLVLVGVSTALYTVLLVLSVISTIKMGTTFNLYWLSMVDGENAQAMKAYLAIALTPQLLLVLFAIMMAGIMAGLLVQRFFALGCVSAALAGAVLYAMAMAAVALSPAPLTSPAVRQVRADPLVAFTTQWQVRQRLLEAAQTIPVNPADWALQDVRPENPCCSGGNVILITMDSVPYARIAPAIAGETDQMPTLAALARKGRSLSAFYSNYPASATSLTLTLLSLYPEIHGVLGDTHMLADRDVATFPMALARAGHDTALFMSGDLANYGVRDFLKRHPIGTLEDNATLRCDGDRTQRMAAYNHWGDDCLTRASANWIKQRKRTYFLWVWLNGTHYPYYSSRNPFDPRNGDPARRAANSLRDADTAIGTVVDAVNRAGQSGNTTIIVTSDHGEAFGEHGTAMHGTTIFEEQVRVPFVISGGKFDPRAALGETGSHIDLGPTILSMAGVPSLRPMQGRSLLDPDHRARTYFFTGGSNTTMGYREGDTKYVYSFADDELVRYNLIRDPDELRPMVLQTAAAAGPTARMAAFMAYRQTLVWPKLKTGQGR